MEASICTATIAGAGAEPEAWHGLEELRGALRAFLARHCSDENELEDVIQETYLRAARYRSSLTGLQRLRPWTMRIALNVLSDWRRRSARATYAPLEDAVFEIPIVEGGVEDGAPSYRVGRWALDREVALEHLARALSTLREDDRLVLDSYYGGERCSRATALACGIPRHLVKIRLYRARQRLLRALRHRVAVEEGWGAFVS